LAVLVVGEVHSVAAGGVVDQQGHQPGLRYAVVVERDGEREALAALDGNLLVEQGVAKGLLYDFKSAKKEGRESTGHGGFGGWGAMAGNLFMAPGDASLDELIGMTKRGILITRLNYTNMAHPAKVLVTGTTRDGTFLIENGKVVGPAKNFRFTESAIRVFGTVDAVGKETVRAGRGANVPAIHVPAFNFTGVTEF
jgi:predicted Zn-dependent protease